MDARRLELTPLGWEPRGSFPEWGEQWVPTTLLCVEEGIWCRFVVTVVVTGAGGEGSFSAGPLALLLTAPGSCHWHPELLREPTQQ